MAGWLETQWDKAKKKFEADTGKKKPDAKGGLFGHKADIAGQLKKLDAAINAGNYGGLNPLLLELERNIATYDKVLDEALRTKTNEGPKYLPALKQLKDSLATVLEEAQTQVDDGVSHTIDDILEEKTGKALEKRAEDYLKALRKIVKDAAALVPQAYSAKDRGAAFIRLSSLEGDVNKILKDKYTLSAVEREAQLHIDRVTERLGALLTDKGRVKALLGRLRKGPISGVAAQVAEAEKLGQEFRKQQTAFNDIYEPIHAAEAGMSRLRDWTAQARKFLDTNRGWLKSRAEDVRKNIGRQLRDITPESDIEKTRGAILRQIGELEAHTKTAAAGAAKLLDSARATSKLVPKRDIVNKANDIRDTIDDYEAQLAALTEFDAFCATLRQAMEKQEKELEGECAATLKERQAQRASDLKLFEKRIPGLRKEWQGLKASLKKEPGSIDADSHIGGAKIGDLFDNVAGKIADYRKIATSDGAQLKKSRQELADQLGTLHTKLVISSGKLKSGALPKGAPYYEGDPKGEVLLDKVADACSWIETCGTRVKQLIAAL